MAIPLWLADRIARHLQKTYPKLGPAADRWRFPVGVSLVGAPTAHGVLDAMIYTPKAGAAGQGVYVNLHGGGFVMRHPEQDDLLCRYLAAMAGVTVVNVDYVPAPQSRFPGPVEQAYDVAVWAASPQRPWDGSRLAVGGQSAGGSLAAAVARLALERGGPQVSLQVLMYPVLDLTGSLRRRRAKGTESVLVPLGRVFAAAYCPDPALRGHRLISPAAPGDTASLAGIAPALVVTAEYDILRQEAFRYAARLREAGALRAHVDLLGTGHGFNLLDWPHDLVEPVYARIAQETRRMLDRDHAGRSTTGGAVPIPGQPARAYERTPGRRGSPSSSSA